MNKTTLPRGRPKGTTKPDKLIQRSVCLSQLDWDYLASLNESASHAIRGLINNDLYAELRAK